MSIMLATLLLYIVGALFLLLFVAWLAVTVYLYLVHRRYAHIPSPKMPRWEKQIGQMGFRLLSMPVLVGGGEREDRRGGRDRERRRD